MFNLPSFSERAKKVLEAGKARGLDRQLVVALAALSEGETGGVWLTERPGGVDKASCCAVVVGLEAAFFSKTIVKDEEAIDFLASRGWVDQDVQEGGSSAGQFVLKPVGGLGNPMKPQKTMLFFEWVVATGKDHLLPIFSIGPTQMHLDWYGDRCGFPGTRDELWDLYTAGATWDLGDDPSPVTDSERITYLVERWLTYLIPKDVYPNGCLSPNVPLPDGSEASGVAWLTNHAGNANTAKRLWDGTFAGGQRRAYSLVWNEVNLIATGIGY